MNKQEERETLFVNLFAGPCSGKSTLAAGLFWLLKTHGVKVELILEYAKDRVWLNDLDTLEFQPYVSAKQAFRVYMVDKKVDIAISDSPLPLGLLYGKYPNSFKPYLLDLFKNYHNLNIILDRLKDFDPDGRIQSEEEAIQKDKEIYEILNNNDIPFIFFKPRHKYGYNDLTDLLSIIKKEYKEQFKVNLEEV
jgi:nicotinamide riboside kinase